MKLYIIYFSWSNTAGNHAGMSYLAVQLEKNIQQIRAIKMISSKYKSVRILNLFYAILLALYFKIILSKKDKVLLMEYMGRGAFQNIIANISKILSSSFEIIGLVHLSANHLLEVYKSEEKIKQKLSYVDRIMVFGSSLEESLAKLGFDKNVIRTFHYVDTDYYRPLLETQKSKISIDSLNIICIGGLKRDFRALREVVINSPIHKFHICQGTNNLTQYFKDCPNVTLYDFLSESELLNLMQKADVSLSLMEDTIGSNVITTSLACSLVQVVSDVGSIRDYCSEEDAIFCKTTVDFINALDFLSRNIDKLVLMQKRARERSDDFSIDNFFNFIKTNIVNE